jgi:hypothetical protein
MTGDERRSASSMPAKLIAASLGLIGFAVAIAAGLAADNSAMTTLRRALGAMAGCWLLGWIVGAIGRRAVLEHVDQYKQAHPIPTPDDAESTNEAASENAAESTSQDAPEPSGPDRDAGPGP